MCTCIYIIRLHSPGGALFINPVLSFLNGRLKLGRKVLLCKCPHGFVDLTHPRVCVNHVNTHLHTDTVARQGFRLDLVLPAVLYKQ